MSSEISILDKLALTPPERDKIARGKAKILGDAAQIGLLDVGRDLPGQLQMALHRDVQAQRIRPNVKIPPRRDVMNYLETMRRETGSYRQAALSLLRPGGWTTSGGSFKLAEDQGIEIPSLMGAVLREKGTARFLEVGAGFAGLKSKAEENGGQRGIAKLVERFNGKLGREVDIHFTNLTDWHTSLPDGVREHSGFLASTIEMLERDGVDADSVDVAYSQCAAYFDSNPELFVARATRLLRKNGFLIFNGQEKNDEVIRQVAERCGLELQKRIVMGGMNGIFYAFRKK